MRRHQLSSMPRAVRDRAERPRMRDLSIVPSPFLEGIFDPADCGASRRQLDRSVGDQPRLPVPVHVLRLGFGDCGQGQPVRVRPPVRRGRMVRRPAIEYVFCLRRELRDPAARRRDRRRRSPRLSAPDSPRRVGAEHQERDRARLPDAEDARRRRPRTRAWRCRCRPRSRPTLKNIKRDNISLETYRELQRRFTPTGSRPTAI